jgi:UDP-N-acetylglucosamine 2-epimerase (hydrolysing)
MRSNKKIRRVIFLTGTRADFGKLKSLMHKLENDPMFETHIFITGMHMLSKYGLTAEEVRKSGFLNIYKFINQNVSDSMDQILAKTVSGLSDYVKEMSPDLLIVHGDRVEALAGAIVGALNNILVAHIEGGEVSGTIDELIRHAVSKLSHLHFVANEKSKNRLIQLGEIKNNIHIIGSPDIDIMNSSELPTLDSVKQHYDFNFGAYSILLFHPVTTDISNLRQEVGILVDQIISSGLNYIVIYPNNDIGSDMILEEYSRFKGNNKIKIYPSMRFEYFLTTLKNAKFIIGNSSAGVREAPHFGVPAINLGTRQMNRVKCNLVIDATIESSIIASSILKAQMITREFVSIFGDGNSADKFHQVISSRLFWECDPQKYFVDNLIQ